MRQYSVFLTVIFLLTSIGISGQTTYIFGNVTNEDGDYLPGVTVFNVSNEQKTMTDHLGHFMLAGKETDEIRILRKGYERQSLKITKQNFEKPIKIALLKAYHDIEEIEIAYQMTGNLKKDLAYIRLPERNIKLNAEMAEYMKGAPTSVMPRNTVPSAFQPPNYSAGQVNFGALIGLIFKEVKKARNPKTTPNYVETQAFYRRVIGEIDLDYYKKFGFDDYGFERFLAYTDKRYQLAKNYRNQFNIQEIHAVLKMALNEYLKTHKVS